MGEGEGVCQELEGEGAVSGSSVISRLRAQGGRIAEHAKSTFRLGVLRALAVASTHYIMDLQRVSSGYFVPSDAEADVASTIMDDAAAAAAEEFATVLAAKLEADIPLLSVEIHRRAATGNTKSREVAGALAGTTSSDNVPQSGTRRRFRIM